MAPALLKIIKKNVYHIELCMSLYKKLNKTKITLFISRYVTYKPSSVGIMEIQILLNTNFADQNHNTPRKGS